MVGFMTENNPANLMASPKGDHIPWSLIVVIIIGTFMAVLNGSIVNVALPRIMVLFNTTADNIQWVLTCYTMALGCVMPVAGYLSDRFGYKRTYFLALALFTAGSALCGLAWNLNSLIAARIIQAVGGGIMQPLGMAYAMRVVPRQRMGVVMGVWGIAAMAAPAIGPTLGGYLVEYVNWRLIFYIMVPVGIFNLWLARRLMQETPLIKGKNFDIWGVISSTIGLFCLLLAISQGNKYGWGSPYIVSLFSLALIALSFFIYNELTHPEPLLELRLFKNYLYTISTFVGIALNIGMFGAMFLLPLLLQSVLGQTAMKTGLILLPAALSTAVMMPISGRIYDKYGGRVIVPVGLAIVTLTTYAMCTFSDLTPYSVMIFWLVLRGMGMGLSMMTVTTLGMITIPLHLVSRASALRNVILQVAASLGIAMFTLVMQNRQIFHYDNLMNSVNLSSTDGLSLQAALQQIAISQNWDATNTGAYMASAIVKRVTTLSSIQAIGDCFLVASAICLVSAVVSLLLRNPRLDMPPKSVEAKMPRPTAAAATKEA